MLAEFRSFMRDDRGLSPVTIEYRCRTIRPFLEGLLGEERSLESVSVSEIDSLLTEKVNNEHYARISVRAYASSLRAFFRYAEFRGWCHTGIAASVMAPRVFQQETLPSGPSWEVVQEILDATAGDHPTEIRDHALLLLFAIYGVRSREVARLQFSDIDWERDRIVFTRCRTAVKSRNFGFRSHFLHSNPGIQDALCTLIPDERTCPGTVKIVNDCARVD
jgi:site-specific recombinase XerD